MQHAFIQQQTAALHMPAQYIAAQAAAARCANPAPMPGVLHHDACSRPISAPHLSKA
jgi:hypothetical protein